MQSFIGLESFNPIFSQWGFSTSQVGLAFISINVGYLLGYLMTLPRFMWELKQRKRNPDSLTPEARLFMLLFTAPLLPIGLFGLAWTSFGPDKTPWIAPMIFAAVFAIANYFIYLNTIDYMVAVSVNQRCALSCSTVR